MTLRTVPADVLAAVRFLTRIPVPDTTYDPDALARSVVYFPLVGLLVGGLAVLVARVLEGHLARPVVALAVVLFLVLVTGGLHEDGLADAADGFGGGWTRERILLIMRDSRIGSYGAIALCLSLGARVLLLGTMAPGRVFGTLVAAQVLCRWTVLPLSAWLPSARVDAVGEGARLAGKTSWAAVGVGTVVAFGITGFLLRWNAIGPVIAVCIIVWVTGWLYQAKIGGVTGDCFGATCQVAEVAVYVCGAWIG
jgi:adenosylcobinamide-GDP ribazoletransferase